VNPKRLTYTNREYEDWIRQWTCIICGQQPVDCHHVEHARQNSYMALPLCRNHHTMNPDSYHRLEKKRFEEKHNIDLSWEIIKKLSQYIEDKVK